LSFASYPLRIKKGLVKENKEGILKFLPIPYSSPQGSCQAMAWLARLAALLICLVAAVRSEMSPVLELVIARFNENLDWISEVDACWNITVYNKGSNATLPKLRPYTSVDVPNTPGGRESETFLRHIIKRYDSLADYTVFSQGGPFVSALFPFLFFSCGVFS
jgi:hypothetical protein